MLDAAGLRRRHHRDRRRRTGRSGHRPHRGHVARDRSCRAPATRCRRSRPASWRSPTSSSSTRPIAKAPIARRRRSKRCCRSSRGRRTTWRPPVLRTVATTGAGVAGAGRRRSSGFASETSAALAERRRARAEWRLREILGRRSCITSSSTMLAPGEFDQLLDRIAAREIDPYARGGVRDGASGRGTRPEPRDCTLDHVGIAVRDARRVRCAFRAAVRPADRTRPRTSGCIGCGSSTTGRRDARAASSRSRRSRRSRKFLDEARRGLAPPLSARRRHRRGAGRARSARRASHRRDAAAGRARIAHRVHPSVERGRPAHGARDRPAEPDSSMTARSSSSIDFARPTARSGSTAARCSASCPKPLWEQARAGRRAQSDSAGHAAAARPHRRRTTVLIDAGIGDKMSAKDADIYAIDRRRHLEHSLAAAGLTADGHRHRASRRICTSITSAASRVRHDGRLVPRFPNARATSSGAASGTTRRIRTSGTARATSPENFVPLAGRRRDRFHRRRRRGPAGHQRVAHRRPHDASSDRSGSSRAAGRRSSPPI